MVFDISSFFVIWRVSSSVLVPSLTPNSAKPTDRGYAVPAVSEPPPVGRCDLRREGRRQIRVVREHARRPRQDERDVLAAIRDLVLPEQRLRVDRHVVAELVLVVQEQGLALVAGRDLVVDVGAEVADGFGLTVAAAVQRADAAVDERRIRCRRD